MKVLTNPQITAEILEAAAERIFNTMRALHLPHTSPGWVRGGNSLKQDEARRYARAAAEVYTHVAPQQWRFILLGGVAVGAVCGASLMGAVWLGVHLWR